MPMTSNWWTIIETIMTAKLDIVTPGETLREAFMEPLGISAYRLAKDIGVSQDRISAILHARRAISLDTAMRFGRYFGTSHQFWINLQTEYEFRRARRDGTLEAIEHQVKPLAA